MHGQRFHGKSVATDDVIKSMRIVGENSSIFYPFRRQKEKNNHRRILTI